MSFEGYFLKLDLLRKKYNAYHKEKLKRKNVTFSVKEKLNY